MELEKTDTAAKDTIGVIKAEIEDAHKRNEKFYNRSERCVSLYRGDGDKANNENLNGKAESGYGVIGEVDQTPAVR